MNHWLHKSIIVSVLLCLLIAGCATSRKTGTVIDSGIGKGIAISNDGSLGQLSVELTVKLEDGQEVKATYMVDQDKSSGLKGKHVEVEPTKDSGWKVVRVLN